MECHPARGWRLGGRHAWYLHESGGLQDIDILGKSRRPGKKKILLVKGDLDLKEHWHLSTVGFNKNLLRNKSSMG